MDFTSAAVCSIWSVTIHFSDLFDTSRIVDFSVNTKKYCSEVMYHCPQSQHYVYDRALLRLYFMVMGILVITTNSQRRNPSARVSSAITVYCVITLH